MKVVEIKTARQNLKFRTDVERLKISICGVQITITHTSLQREKTTTQNVMHEHLRLCFVKQNNQLRSEIKGTNPQERIKYF
jgi:hypothetical protein